MVEGIAVATYAVGDVQGCFKSLQQLLARIDYRPEIDRIIFLGDLVNRGPDSLAVLEWAVGQKASAVLGNHDLYCLGVHLGLKRSRSDTLEKILLSPARERLMDWLRHRPFVLERDDAILLHAAVHPDWNDGFLSQLNRKLMGKMAADDWAQTLSGWAARRTGDAPVDILTRGRLFDRTLTPQAAFKGPPEDAPDGLSPWYENATIGRVERPIIFGHWAALGFRDLGRAIALDGGCVWGGELCALRLEDRAVFRVPAVPSDISTLEGA